MMRIARNIALLAGVNLAIGAGCSAGGGAKPPPGRSAVAAVVRAEPKTGWKDPAQHGSAYDPVEIGGSRVYKTVNYTTLDEIVVWIELPAGQTAAAPQRLTIDVGRPSGALHTGGLMDAWTIVNSAPESLSAYARYESGRIVDLGTIAPGSEVSHQPHEAGAVDIVCEPKPDAVARVFVAPIPTVAKGNAHIVTSGERVVFNDLPSGGTARIVCWHPRLPGSAIDIMLVPGVTSNATLVMGVNLLPKVP